MTGDGRRFEVRAVGVVESPLADRAAAPRQGDEGAPPAWLIFDPHVREAVADLVVGDEVVVVTWLHLARRDVLTTHPRDDPSRPELGVFSTRGPDRPNPIGLHPATIIAVEDLRVQVDRLEVVDGTPVLDLKPAL